MAGRSAVGRTVALVALVLAAGVPPPSGTPFAVGSIPYTTFLAANTHRVDVTAYRSSRDVSWDMA
ncbi:hypothetical protein Nans01_12240 [Nocardiopsis ansamitocini]|uniref:Uncharacterized protein n=1 Tax=Nocardiopsis ansamitocini TaxID=1670832 RepID=A0A9W6P4C3_9ACTN|nr:hypothetical protein Nans01_12240 [Nocardiopsis ansamitocini]